MWLEQTIVFWAPLAGAALFLMLLRLRTLTHEVRSLRERIAQLEDERSSVAPAQPALQKRNAA